MVSVGGRPVSLEDNVDSAVTWRLRVNFEFKNLSEFEVMCSNTSRGEIVAKMGRHQMIKPELKFSLDRPFNFN